jgi:Tol biopolymer transport system component
VDAEGTNEPARLDELVVEAEWSPDGKSVAYVTQVEGPPAFPYSGETYVWEPGSSAPRRIVDGSSPAWSPTGGSLAFTRNGSLWRIDIASGTQQPLLRAAMPILDEPRWSPDGRYIAFRAQNVGGEIRAIDVDGPNERYLGLGASASYSPDGERIAFMAGSGGLGFAGNLMAMQADGTRIVALAHVFYGDTIPACPGRQYAWSPDSQQIAFADLNAEVKLVGAAGGEDPRTLGPGYGPSFFPDSASVVYGRSDRSGPPGCTVYSRSTAAPAETALAEGVRNPLVSADGRYLVGELDSFYRVPAVSVIELARPENRVDVPQAWFPALSRDGSRVAYFIADGTQGSVFPPYGSPGRIVVAALNARATTLAEVTVPVAVRDIAWSPDGSELAYSVSTQDGTSIYVVDIANLGAPRRLTEGYSPSWSPDGQTILFARYEN